MLVQLGFCYLRSLIGIKISSKEMTHALDPVIGIYSGLFELFWGSIKTGHILLDFLSFVWQVELDQDRHQPVLNKFPLRQISHTKHHHTQNTQIQTITVSK